MIWLTWRQFRAQASVATAILAAIAVAFAITGPHVASMYAANGLAACHSDCGTLGADFLNQLYNSSAENVLYHLGPWVVYAVPSLIGAFWGAPLITRELETGTFRLTWNQSITRTRWTAVKLGLVGLASMVLAGLLSLAVTWWSSPIERVTMVRLTPGVFGSMGIVPVGYAAFAFAAGVTAGVLIRRTLPAMAVTLAVVCGAQVAMAMWIRDHLIAPLHAAVPLPLAVVQNAWAVRVRTRAFTVYPQSVSIPGAWIVGAPHAITTAAHAASTACMQELAQNPNNAATPPACVASLARLHLTETVAYEPLSRYWAFQWYETGIFLALAVALAAFCLWRIRRRIT